MSEESDVAYRREREGTSRTSNGYGSFPAVGELLSRSYEPPPGWRGRLSDALSKVLLFESEDECSPHLPTLLPAFCLLSPHYPDFPGSARVAWSQRENHGSVDAAHRSDTYWLPREIRALLRPGTILERLGDSDGATWLLDGRVTLLPRSNAARPRLVLAPPRRRVRSEVHSAVLLSLQRAVRSMPPDDELKRLVDASRRCQDVSARPLDLSRLRGLVELAGFGHGRTARGDDYLVGFICGLDLASSIDAAIDANHFHEFRSSFVAMIAKAASNTTLLGQQVLRAAFHGLYSAPLLEEADALSDGIIIGPGEPEWTLRRRPTISPGWPALLGLLTGAYVIGSTHAFARHVPAR